MDSYITNSANVVIIIDIVIVFILLLLDYLDCTWDNRDYSHPILMFTIKKTKEKIFSLIKP